MTKLGSGDNGELTFLDIVGLMSFFIGVQNLDLNVTQEDAQNLQKELADKASIILNEIHKHLEEQDKKIDKILEVLNDDSGGNL